MNAVRPDPVPPDLVSPVSVTVTAVTHSADFIRPRLRADRRDRLALHAGVQINGAPHVGTNVMQTAAFLLAEAARDRFGVETVLRFGALDNTACDTRTCARTGTLYERSYHHALGPEAIGELTRRYYGGLFDSLSAATGVPYEVQTYTAQQSGSVFREEFLRSLVLRDELRWVLAPSSGRLPLSFPCPECGWSQKHGEGTELLEAGTRQARARAVCLDHGTYAVDVTPESQVYIGSTTLHRNLVKERAAARDDALPVIVKGADWAAGCRLLDEAFWCYAGATPPPRVFTPVILSESGAKLSKSLIQEGKADLPAGIAPWMLDVTLWEGPVEEYAHLLLRLVSLMLSDPRHFERGYTTRELARLIGSDGGSGAAA